MANLEIKGSSLARNALLNFLGQTILVLIGAVTIPFIIAQVTKNTLAAEGTA